ncbi:MAG: hypothetical protein FJZ01_03655 [Candidatus Sericytochromatia bacterium]|nr:hypothetical protein [Candidatus Tanganyikabacteria bacterium]
MAVAMVSAANAPQKRQALVTSVAAAQPRSLVDNLILTNKAMLRQVKDDAVGALKNPLGPLGTMLEGLVYPFLHPVATVKGMIKAVKEDPADGLASAAGTVGGLGWFTAVVVAALAVVAAPVTGGASLAIAAPAFAVGNAFFAGLMIADTAGILLHQYRGATAKSSGEAMAEGVAMASYVEDQALNILAWAGSNALETRVGRMVSREAARAGGRVVGEGLGVMGIYDMPAAQVRHLVQKAGAAAKPVVKQAKP